MEDRDKIPEHKVSQGAYFPEEGLQRSRWESTKSNPFMVGIRLLDVSQQIHNLKTQTSNIEYHRRPSA